jgi:hypothetical protein
MHGCPEIVERALNPHYTGMLTGILRGRDGTERKRSEQLVLLAGGGCETDRESRPRTATCSTCCLQVYLK